MVEVLRGRGRPWLFRLAEGRPKVVVLEAERRTEVWRTKVGGIAS